MLWGVDSLIVSGGCDSSCCSSFEVFVAAGVWSLLAALVLLVSLCGGFGAGPDLVDEGLVGVAEVWLGWGGWLGAGVCLLLVGFGAAAGGVRLWLGLGVESELLVEPGLGCVFGVDGGVAVGEGFAWLEWLGVGGVEALVGDGEVLSGVDGEVELFAECDGLCAGVVELPHALVEGFVFADGVVAELLDVVLEAGEGVQGGGCAAGDAAVGEVVFEGGVELGDAGGLFCGGLSEGFVEQVAEFAGGVLGLHVGFEPWFEQGGAGGVEVDAGRGRRGLLRWLRGCVFGGLGGQLGVGVFLRGPGVPGCGGVCAGGADGGEPEVGCGGVECVEGCCGGAGDGAGAACWWQGLVGVGVVGEASPCLDLAGELFPAGALGSVVVRDWSEVAGGPVRWVEGERGAAVGDGLLEGVGHLLEWGDPAGGHGWVGEAAGGGGPAWCG